MLLNLLRLSANGGLFAIALLLMVPSSVLALECLAAFAGRRRLPRNQEQAAKTGSTPSLAILMPAHNEASVIQQTLETLKPQLADHQRLIVIADNCTDDTAEIARAVGADVIERSDTERRGKGYALDYGLQHLASDPPDIVIFIDADCDVQPGAIPALAQAAAANQRPAQAIYLMETPATPPHRRRKTPFPPSPSKSKISCVPSDSLPSASLAFSLAPAWPFPGQSFALLISPAATSLKT